MFFIFLRIYNLCLIIGFKPGKSSERILFVQEYLDLEKLQNVDYIT